MFGISVYLADLTAAERTCAHAHEPGIDLLFTSLHISEDDPARYSRRLRELARIACNQLTLVADISGELAARV